MLSATAKYAITAMTHLAKKDSTQFYSVSALASEVDVPQQYLAKIMKTLVSAGILEARRGPSGGIRILKKKGLHYSLWDICEALNEPVARQTCFMGRAECTSKDHCTFHKDWTKQREQVKKFLLSIKLT